MMIRQVASAQRGDQIRGVVAARVKPEMNQEVMGAAGLNSWKVKNKMV